MQQDDLATIVG